jgi:hypothetical protein
MSREFLNHDPLNGITEYLSYDQETDTTTIESVGDCSPIIELNKKLQNDPDVWKEGMKNDFALYASIPPIFQLKLLQDHNINVWKKEDGPRLSKILEDPEYRFLKTTTKRHIIKC